MSDDVTTDSGQDPTKAVLGALDGSLKQTALDLMDVWFSESQRRLVEAAQQRAGGEGADDSEGRIGRRQNALTDMLDEFQPPEWRVSEQAAVWTITHAAAVFHEFGARPHEIKAKQAEALAFEWPDAPDEVAEQFESSFPTVFFNSVEHPGVPAIGMVRHGRDRMQQRARNRGVDIEGLGTMEES